MVPTFPNWRRIWPLATALLIAALIGALASACGGSSSPSPSAGSATPPAGQTTASTPTSGGPPPPPVTLPKDTSPITAAVTLTVDSTGDDDKRDDKLTLREAMMLANGKLAASQLTAEEGDNVNHLKPGESAGPGPDSADAIIFDPGTFSSDTAVIQLSAPLPEMSGGHDSVHGGESVVTVDGKKLAADNGFGLTLNSDGNSVSGMRLFHFGGAAIKVTRGQNVIGPANVISGNNMGVLVTGTTAEGNHIAGNLLGIDTSGVAAMGNVHGIWMENGADKNTVGGVTAEERNYLSGNKLTGISFWGAHDNVLIGNYIGPDLTGGRALPNSRGLRVDVGGSRNRIGGAAPGERNVISGNGIGVELSGTGTTANKVLGNYIGLDAGGATALGNGTGVNIEEGPGTGPGGQTTFPEGPTESAVGGTGAGEANVISGNTSSGIQMISSRHNQISGNLIGLDPQGTRAIPNGAGITLTDRSRENVIGPGNLISGNQREGLAISGTDTFGNSVVGNKIGVTASGAALGNGGNGVRIIGPARDNRVGVSPAPMPQSPADANTIAFNGGSGILLKGTSGNTTEGNDIHDNAGQSIETVA